MSTSVAVCVLTYHRPRGLERVLAGIGALEEPEDVDVSVVVVDNDPEGSATAIVDAARSAMRWPVTYVVEPRRGIPAARNAAIAAAGAAELVAFIDDDEVPDPRWLAELVRVRCQTGADVVTGPVLPEFEVPPPAWITRGRFFERVRFEDGARMSWATTSSVLIDRRIIPTDQPPFNERMALTGGSDTHFFLRAHLQGRRMVWADHALVTETIPATRTTLRWLLQRHYRRGNTQTLCMLDLRGTPMRWARKAARGVLVVLHGIALLLLVPVGGRPAAVRALLRAADGVGTLAGLAGRRYREYETVHGD